MSVHKHIFFPFYSLLCAVLIFNLSNVGVEDTEVYLSAMFGFSVTVIVEFLHIWGKSMLNRKQLTSVTAHVRRIGVLWVAVLTVAIVIYPQRPQITSLVIAACILVHAAIAMYTLAGRVTT